MNAGDVIMRFNTAKLDRRELCVQGGLLAISVIVVVVWVLTKPIVFTYDSFTYIDVARELASGKSSNSYYFRLPLYPAILLVFHVTDLSRSVFWLVVFQACLAIASVWLFYLSARLLEPRGAVVVSLLFLASLLPFLHVKYIMTEQTFLFATILTLYGITRFLMAPSVAEALLSIVILTVGAALMMLTRPQGAYVGPLLLIVAAALAWRRAWIPLIGGLLLFFALWSAQMIDQRARSGSWNWTFAFDSSHTAGKQLFLQFYLDAPRRGVDLRVSPENGPATAELKRLLSEELLKPENSARQKGHMPGVTPEQVPAYVEQMFQWPPADVNFFHVAMYGLDQRLGLAGADQLLLRASLEAALAYPIQTSWMFLQKGFEIYFNPPQLAVPLTESFPPLPTAAFHPPLSEEIAAAGDSTDANATAFDRAIDRNVRWMMRIAIVVAILTLPIALRCRTWRVTIALLLFGLYLNGVVIVGGISLFRFAIYAIPVNLMCAFIGAVALISALWPRATVLYSKVGAA